MHTAFMENRSATLIGRTDILETVDLFVKGQYYDVTKEETFVEDRPNTSGNGASSPEKGAGEEKKEEEMDVEGESGKKETHSTPLTDVPFVILGGPGLGKSSIMAKIADIYTRQAAQGQLPE